MSRAAHPEPPREILWRRLARESIWHPDAIPKSEAKYAAPLKRVGFPVFDLVVIVLGALGLRIGFQALSLAFPPPGPTVLYLVLVAAGAVCFVSCAFPRLWLPEIIGKFVIGATLGVVLVAMIVAGVTVPGHTGLMVAPILVVMMLFPLLRLWILGWEIADREARKRAERAGGGIAEGAAWSG